MKRAFFEWGAIGGVMLSLLLLVYWLFSICTRAADFDLIWWVPRVGASASDGMMLLGTVSLEMIEVFESGAPFFPAPLGRGSFALPGMRMGYVKYADGHLGWYLHFTLLIPAMVLMPVGLICGWMYWQIRASALAKGTKAKDAPTRSMSRRAGCMR